MNSQNSTISAKTVAPNQEQCEACGATFGCAAQTNDCWCNNIELSDETRAELKSKFKRCLCRNCLDERAAPHVNV